MRILEGRNTSGSIKTQEVFESIKTHQVSRGERSIKTHEVFGSNKTHEVSEGETQKWVHQSTQGFMTIKHCLVQGFS